MRRLLINDALSQLGERTFWNLLMEWFDMEFLGGPFESLHQLMPTTTEPVSLIIRNATYFKPLENYKAPTISLLQDILPEGPLRRMQEAVCNDSTATVFNSRYTAYKYGAASEAPLIIPLPVDFSLFTPQNALACQQALGLPDGCVCWIGASQGAAGHVKGWDVLVRIARLNPDLNFVAVLKDAPPQDCPPNMRCYARLSQAALVQVIGACRVGLCTSRSETQHLAGIEMGACGLPMVAPNVGVYWNRTDAPVIRPLGPDAKDYSDCLKWSGALRETLRTVGNMEYVRSYWQREFDIPIVRAQWEALVKEVGSE